MQELLEPRVFGRCKDVLRRCLNDNWPAIEEDDAVGGLRGKSHLVSDDDHSHAATRQLLYDGEHFTDKLRIER